MEVSHESKKIKQSVGQLLKKKEVAGKPQ